jgi:hypothetical protein
MTDAEIKAAILDGLAQIAPESDPAELSPNENIRRALDIDSFDFLNFLIEPARKAQRGYSRSRLRQAEHPRRNGRLPRGSHQVTAPHISGDCV